VLMRVNFLVENVVSIESNAVLKRPCRVTEEVVVQKIVVAVLPSIVAIVI
jgi:hypothetical protein